MTCVCAVNCESRLRMYGRVRLPLLLQGWSIEAFIGFDGQVQTLTFGARINLWQALTFLQALDCVDGAPGWGDESMHAFRSPGAHMLCSIVSIVNHVLG